MTKENNSFQLNTSQATTVETRNAKGCRSYDPGYTTKPELNL